MFKTFTLKSPVNAVIDDNGWHTGIREWRGNRNMHKLISAPTDDDTESQLVYDENTLRYPDLAEYEVGKEYHVGDYMYVEISSTKPEDYITVNQPTAIARVYRCLKDHTSVDRWFARHELADSKVDVSAQYKQDELDWESGDADYMVGAQYDENGNELNAELAENGLPELEVYAKGKYDPKPYDSEKNFWEHCRDLILYTVYDDESGETMNNEIIVAPDGKCYTCKTEHIPLEVWDETEAACWEEYELEYDGCEDSSYKTSSYEMPWVKLSELTGESVSGTNILSMNGRSSYYIYSGSDDPNTDPVQKGFCVCNNKTVVISGDVYLKAVPGTSATLTIRPYED